MRRRVLIVFTISLIGLLSYQLYSYFNSFNSAKDSHLSSRKEWHTFQKTDLHGVKDHPTTQEEKKEGRLPASLPPSPSPSVRKSAREGARQRILLPGQKWDDQASALNKPHKEWKKRMGNDLLRFLSADTKLFVRPLESLTINTKGHPHHVEKVLVKLSTPKGRLYSYNALVDSESGKLIKTWNRTIHEDIAQKRPTKMRPSGAMTREGTIRY